MASEKPKPAVISTEVANTGSSREQDVHTVSPVSPLFEESHDLAPHSSSATEENPPPKPPRPLSPQQQVQLTLAEAFPTVEPNVIKAVLIASKGEVEPAFNALLAMTDPSFVPEEAPAPPPHTRSRTYSPRVDSRYPPQQQHRDYNPALVYQDRIDLTPPTATPRSQLEADELYARQLAEHLNNTSRPRGRGGAQNQAPPRHSRQESDEDFRTEKEHSFLEDDLPIIKENIRQGFLQTQSKVNQWVAELKKKIDGEPTSPELQPTYQDPRSAHGRSRGGPSGYSNYDADPRVLGDDFAHLELRNNTQEEVPPRRPPRPVANPKLFQNSPTSSASTGQRKVSFQNVSDDDLYQQPTPRSVATSSTGVAKQPAPPAPAPASKWQPLKSVEPTPLDGDGDPFSLGDSEDEREHALSQDTEAKHKAGVNQVGLGPAKQA
ncbi:hypothetical protein BDZ91DRAFT_674971 [Kalaharituber pfeilii]|nr:hypothetical protein BDZ91DRAFT_674971 [Kalaharituber pfeilii]